MDLVASRVSFWGACHFYVQFLRSLLTTGFLGGWCLRPPKAGCTLKAPRVCRYHDTRKSQGLLLAYVGVSSQISQIQTLSSQSAPVSAPMGPLVPYCIGIAGLRV